MYRKRYYLLILSLLAVISLYTALDLGTVKTSWVLPWQSWWHPDGSLPQQIILQLRLPRALSAFTTGGLLALAGCLMQVLLRNPLADPYILGVSGGAACGALLTLLLGISSFWLTPSALLGALLSMLFVFGLAGHNTQDNTRLLLTGVVTASGWAAIISFILIISPKQNLHSMLFWLMGDFSYSNHPLFPSLFLIIGLLLSLSLARPLNILLRGNYQAQGLGVNTKQLTLLIYILSASLTAVAVTNAGTIGFVGLIVPHLLRLLLGSDHRLLLPAAVLLGGSLVCFADSLARILIAPQQLPVGIITAIIGIPLFLYLLQHSYRRTTS